MKKKIDKGIGMGSVPLGGSYEGGKVSTHSETPSLVGLGEASEPQERERQQVCSRQSAGNFAEISADSTPSLRCLSTCPLRRVGAGAETRAQRPDLMKTV